LQVGILDRLEAALLKSGKFRLAYSNRDVQIFEYDQSVTERWKAKLLEEITPRPVKGPR